MKHIIVLCCLLFVITGCSTSQGLKYYDVNDKQLQISPLKFNIKKPIVLPFEVDEVKTQIVDPNHEVHITYADKNLQNVVHFNVINHTGMVPPSASKTDPLNNGSECWSQTDETSNIIYWLENSQTHSLSISKKNEKSGKYEPSFSLDVLKKIASSTK